MYSGHDGFYDATIIRDVRTHMPTPQRVAVIDACKQPETPLLDNVAHHPSS